MVANLLNVDNTFAQRVADGLGMGTLPERSEPAKAPVDDLPPSNALSIAKNPPNSFEGRKVGLMITDGFDQTIFEALRAAVRSANATLELIAPTVGGATSATGELVPADHKLGGAPSVLYDAVVLLSGNEGGKLLAKHPAARDFVADAFAHCKLIGYGAPAKPLLEKAGVFADLDEGCLLLEDVQSVGAFLKQCRALRYWPREAVVAV